MSGYEKPLPETTTLSKPFWEASKSRVLKVQRCRRCGSVQLYPRASCVACGSREIEWKESSGTGTVYAYTVVRMVIANSPAWQKDIPYAFGIIDLDEGTRMYGRILGVRLEDVRVGMRVRVEFEEATPEVAIPHFKPAMSSP